MKGPLGPGAGPQGQGPLGPTLGPLPVKSSSVPWSLPLPWSWSCSRGGAEGASSPVRRSPRGAHPGSAYPQPICGTPRSGDPGGPCGQQRRGAWW